MNIVFVMRNFLLTMITLILMYSCNENKNTGNTIPLETFKVDPAIAKVVSMDSIFIDEEKIPLSTSDSGLVDMIGDFKISNNRFYILTFNHNVFSFSKNGSLIYKIDQQGKGPTEYVFPICLYADPGDKYLEIFNRGSKNAVLVDSLGKYMSGWKYDLYITKATHYKDLTCLLVGSFLNFIDDKECYKQLFIYDSLHNMQTGYLPFDNENGNFLGVGDRIDMVHMNDNLHVRVQYNDTVYCLTKNENGINLYPKYLFDYGKYAIPEIFHKDLKNITKLKRLLQKGNCVYDVYRYLETNEHIYFSFKHKKTAYNYFYSKKTKQAKIIRQMIIPFKGFVYKRKIRFKDVPIAADNDYLYFIMEPGHYIKEMENIKKHLDNKKWEKFKAENKEYYEFVKGLSIMDNPIIVKRKINPDLFN